MCRCTGYHNIVKSIQAAAGGAQLSPRVTGTRRTGHAER